MAVEDSAETGMSVFFSARKQIPSSGATFGQHGKVLVTGA